MKFSTEAIVALAVAGVFALLSMGAIAREQGQAPAPGRHKASLSLVAASETDVFGFY